MRIDSKGRKAQTILELVFVLLMLSFLMAVSFGLFSVFDISQKQVMLVRAQAFMELGGHSDFAYGRHGEDDPKNNQSQLLFRLGENTEGTRVNLDGLKSFTDVVKGELKLQGPLAVANSNGSYWDSFRFPRGKTQLSSRAAYSNRERASELFSIELQQNLWIAHGRSIQPGRQGRSEGLDPFTGSVKFFDLEGIANSRSGGGAGLVDNRDTLLQRLGQIAQADPSLADEARQLERSINAADSLAGGAEAALISLALQLALQAGLSALGDALGPEASGGVLGDGVTPGAAGGAVGDAAGAAGSGGFSFGIPDFFGFTLKEGQNLYNFGQVMNFTSQVTQTANLGFNLGGQNIEGLQEVAGITGALGGVTIGAHNLGSATLASEGFRGAGQVVGGVGQGVGLANADAGRALGIAGSGLGFGGSLAGLGEGFSADSVWRDSDGNWRGGAGWQATSAVGGAIGQAGGIIAQADPGSQVGAGFSFVGGAVGVVGSGGSFAHNVETGSFDGKPFQAMAAAGGLAAAVSATGISAAQLTGNHEMAEGFAYGALAGGAVAVVGALGMLAEGVGEQISKANARAKERKAQEAAGDGSGSSPASADSSGVLASAETSKTSSTNAGATGSESTLGTSAAGGASTTTETPKLEGFALTQQRFEDAGTAVMATQFALQIANTAKNAMAAGIDQGLQSNGTDEFRRNAAAVRSNPERTIQIATEQLNQLSSQVQSKLPPQDFARYESLMRDVNLASREMQKPDTERNELIIQRGIQASNEANEILMRALGVPEEGTPERDAWSQARTERIRSAHQEYQSLIQRDGQVLSLMYHAEQHLDGRVIVESDPQTRRQIRQLGREASEMISHHRQNYYTPDNPLFDRLQRAERHWRRPQFMETREALRFIRKNVEEHDRKYRQLKHSIVDSLRQTERVN